MAKAKKKMQVVDDDQIENVGIMSGFMDDLDEIMAEIDAEMEPNADKKTSSVLDRRPDSPEILMNNLRGDYRSIDARREELADLVGYNNAAETPDDVLALLQPVLAKQGVASLGGAPPAMPQNTPTAQPASTPPGLTPPGGVASLPMAQGPDMAPPMPMAKGGIVRHFSEGSEDPDQNSDMSYFDYPPELVAAMLAKRKAILQQQPEALPDVMAKTKELSPQYAELLGVADSGKDARSQMMFDIAQAALNFAGNVGPQGQPLTGSFASRLAAASSQLPGKIGARAAEAKKGEAQARLAAFQQAQAEREATTARNVALSEQQSELLKDITSRSPLAGKPLTLDQKTEYGITGSEYENMPWVFDRYGIPTIAGGKPAAGTTVNVGGTDVALTPGQEAMDKKFGEVVFDWMSGGGQDMNAQIAQLGTVAQELENIEIGTSDKDLTGMQVGLTPTFIRTFTNPDSVDAKEQVEQVVQRNLKLILGAQFTQNEGERLIARAYNDKLGEGKNAARVRRLLLQMTASAQQKQAMVDYFNENGTLAGFTGKMPTIADFEKAIDGAEGYTSADLMGNASRGLSIIGEEGNG